MEAAKDWYDAQRVGLGDEFLECVEEVFDRLRQVPGAHAAVHGDVRRALVRRFPYVVYYRIDDDLVTVLAIMHSHRDPAAWQGRV